MARLEEIVRRAVAERRASGERPDDLLSMLLDARDAESGEPMSDRQLRDEVLTTLFGGYEATADSLAWTWHLLARHPQADARLRAEVDAVMADDAPTAEELGRMDYTRRVIMESMRLYPPFWWNLRAAREDDEVGGTRIPAGATVLLVTYATHRHPEFWDDPERFDPDRFLPEAAARAPARLRPVRHGTARVRGPPPGDAGDAAGAGDARPPLSPGPRTWAAGRLPRRSLPARAGRRVDDAGGGGSA